MTIKRNAADFRVEEIPDPQWLDSLNPERGSFAVFRLTKKSLTTPQAVEDIAKTLNVARSDVSYAGLKDRHAETSQHISVRPDPRFASKLPVNLPGRGWRIDRIGWADDHVASPIIAGNRFHIVVRDMTHQAVEDMNEAVALLIAPGSQAENADPTRPGSLRIVNYFGDQRFGSARHGQGFVARALIAGDFEHALQLSIAIASRKDTPVQKRFKRTLADGWGKWTKILHRLPKVPERRAVERLAAGSDFSTAFTALPTFFQQMCVEAYQSHLWNATARHLLVTRAADNWPLIVADDPYGELVFPAAESVPDDLLDLNLPMLAPRTTLAEPWNESAKAVLESEGIAVSDLKIPGLKRPYFGEAPRRLFIHAEDFWMSHPQPDDTPNLAEPRQKRQVAFTLPRGAYATVVLRALGE